MIEGKLDYTLEIHLKFRSKQPNVVSYVSKINKFCNEYKNEKTEIIIYFCKKISTLTLATHYSVSNPKFRSCLLFYLSSYFLQLDAKQ